MSKIIFFHTERGDVSNGLIRINSPNLVDFYVTLSRFVDQSILLLPRLKNLENAKFAIGIPEGMIARSLPFPDPSDSLLKKIFSFFLFLKILFGNDVKTDIASSDVSVSAGLELNGTLFGMLSSLVLKKRHAFVIRGNRLMTISQSSRSFPSRIFAMARVFLYQFIIEVLVKHFDVQLWFQGQHNYELFRQRVGTKFEKKLFLLNAVLREMPSSRCKCCEEKSTDLVYIGRITLEKGIRDLLEAISLLNDEGVEIRLDIVGVGPYLETAKRLSRSLNVEKNVNFVGYVADVADLAAYYKKARFFILPSHTEGLPRSMLESMANGTPVLVTDVGGIPYVIKDGVNGYLVKAKSPDILAQRIKRVLNLDADELNTVIDNAKKDAEQFTFDQRAKYFLFHLLKGC